jgi:hypothetical protein
MSAAEVLSWIAFDACRRAPSLPASLRRDSRYGAKPVLKRIARTIALRS